MCIFCLSSYPELFSSLYAILAYDYWSISVVSVASPAFSSLEGRFEDRSLVSHFYPSFLTACVVGNEADCKGGDTQLWINRDTEVVSYVHVVFSCQVLFDYYAKSKAELGVFPVNPHWTSSLSCRGLLNCEYNSLVTLACVLVFRSLCFFFHLPWSFDTQWKQRKGSWICRVAEGRKISCSVPPMCPYFICMFSDVAGVRIMANNMPLIRTPTRALE